MIGLLAFSFGHCGEFSAVQAAAPLSRIESSYLWSNVRDIVGDSEYVYCAIGPGIQIYDIQIPSTPVLVSETLLSRRPLSLDYRNDKLFVGIEDSGAIIFDVSNRASPVLLTTIGIACTVWEIAASDSVLYLGCEHSVQLFDVSIENSPELVSSIDLPNEWEYVRDLLAIGDTLIVAAYDLWIYDCTNLSNPQVISHVHDENYLAWSLAKRDSLLIVGNESPAIPGYRSAIALYSISDSELPLRLGDFEFYGDVLEVAVQDDIVAFAGDASGFAILDISDPTNILSLSCRRHEDYRCNCVFLQNDRLVLGSTFNRAFPQNFSHRDLCTGANWGIDGVRGPLANWMEIYDLAPPNAPLLLGTVKDHGVVGATQINGTSGYVIEEIGGMTLIDMHTTPHKTGYFPFALQDLDIYTGDLEREGNMVYLARPSFGVFSIDISNISDPVILDSVHLYYVPVGNLEAPAEAVELEIVGDFLYVCTGIYGLVVIDKSDPSQLTILGSINPGGGVVDIAVEGNRAYIAAGLSGGFIIDISDPADPMGLTSFTPSGFNVVTNVAVRNGIIAYSGMFSSFKLADANDADNVITLTTVTTRALESVNLDFRDSILIVGEDKYGISLYNVATPSQPTLIQTITMAGNIKEMNQVGDKLFVGSEVAGYELIFDPILDVKESHEASRSRISDFVRISSVSPNPFNAATSMRYEVNRPGMITVLVNDILGRRVRTIGETYHDIGSFTITWDGRDDGGANLASGVYFVSFRGGGSLVSTKVLLLK